MKRLFSLRNFLVVATVAAGTFALSSYVTAKENATKSSGNTACEVYGKIKIVDYGEDYEVKKVDYGEDVKAVSNFI